MRPSIVVSSPDLWSEFMQKKKRVSSQIEGHP
jgi:hypothetical protein